MSVGAGTHSIFFNLQHLIIKLLFKKSYLCMGGKGEGGSKRWNCQNYGTCSRYSIAINHTIRPMIQPYYLCPWVVQLQSFSLTSIQYLSAVINTTQRENSSLWVHMRRGMDSLALFQGFCMLNLPNVGQR